MGIAAVLAAVALIMFLASPVLLTSGRWQLKRPLLALRCWLAALVLGCLAFFGAGAMTIGAGARGDSATPLLIWAAAWLVLALLGSWATMIIASYGSFHEHANTVARDLRGRWLSWIWRDSARVIVLDSDHPQAFSVSGPPPEIYLSVALIELLDSEEREAVICHEVSHVRRHHEMVLRIAAVNYACLPEKLRVARIFRDNVLQLIEFIADDDAVARVSPGVQIRTLLKVSTATGERSLQTRARRLAVLHPDCSV